MDDISYQAQSTSLKFVQKFGPELERAIKASLGWDSGRVVYFEQEGLKYDLQVDSCFPNIAAPEVFVSVTYCKPDKPGHSNENKLQLKLGELLLLKARFPRMKAVLVIGGNENTWLPYVLKAFTYFFDKTIYAWDQSFDEDIKLLKEQPQSIPLRHENTWAKLSEEWNSIELSEEAPINSFLRSRMWEMVSETGCEGELPENISNEIFRHCMNAAYALSLKTRNKSGKEWNNYLNENWGKLWESRSFFNPAEAAIDLALTKNEFAFKGGLAKDEQVPSLIHSLGGSEIDKTKLSEDFVLFSKKLNKPVFIQSKATGGGLARHGKNIQNRTKEQTSRSLLYRGKIVEEQIILRDKDYCWIGVLDGNWGVTKKTPLKYIHMLQWAGYDYLLGADSLVDEELNINYDNELIQILKDLDCMTIHELESFESEWQEWVENRKAILHIEPNQTL